MAYPLLDVSQENIHKDMSRRNEYTLLNSAWVIMYKKLISLILASLLLAVLIPGCHQESNTPSSENISDKKKGIKLKPFRVLIIIGDQWTDPMSYSIDPVRVKGTDFLDVVNMLKIWGVPFDILRLDEQRLQINRFLDGQASPNYGCIIWMADPDKLQGFSADYRTLNRAVKEYGISMIALFDYIKTKEVADLVGVSYQGVTNVQMGQEGERLSISGKHYITAEAGNVQLPDQKLIAQTSIPDANGITPAEETSGLKTSPIQIIRCTAGDSIQVLGTVGHFPQLAVRDVNRDTKVVWMGGGKDWFRKFPVMRGMFRKALIYSIGYGVFNDNFENGLIFIMDDVGCSEHAWSLRWHYPTPRKDTLIKYLIEPLEKQGFIMVQNITPGFANPVKKIIESSWNVKPFRDIFGNWQDYGSTKEGLDEGLRRGVFEIQAHRAWSHMNWDLDSSPGPWWGSAVDGELAVTDWYNEVVDVRRDHAPVPSNDLLFIYKTGIDAIVKSFHVVPLAAEVRPGSELQAGKTGGYDNGRIAAIAGIGVSRECYVGFDHTIEFTMMMPEQFTCHDLDLTAKTNYPADQTEAGWDALLKMTTEQLISSKIAGGRRINLHDNLNWIESRKDKHWMGFNETCAYLHAQIASPEGNGFSLDYDDHYCKYFEKKSSRWTLEWSERLREDLGGNTTLWIDGNKLLLKNASEQTLEIPAGLGTHHIEVH
jgi:hypothetical protein